MKKIVFGPLQKKYQGKIFTITERPVILPNGQRLVFEYCERKPSVCVLAFDKKKELLMIRELRAGTNTWEWFLPAGRVDQVGDTPRRAAARELREETGWIARKIKLLSRKPFPSDKIIWDIFTYVATDLTYDPQPNNEGEVIEPVFMPLKKAVEMALQGTIADDAIACTIIRFDYLVRTGKFKW